LRRNDKKEVKELNKQLAQLKQMIEALQKLSEAERNDLQVLKANRKLEEDAIAELKTKRKAEAARLRSLEDKARQQEELIAQLQKNGAAPHGSPALLRGYSKTRDALDKLPPSKSMVAAVIDESLIQPTQSPRSTPNRSPRQARGDGDVAKLRSTLAELQLRRGVLQASLVDLERSVGKKKDSAQKMMVTEITAQLGDCDAKSRKIEAEIAAIQAVTPEDRLRELLGEVRDDVKTMKKLARIMTDALPKIARSESTGSPAPATPREPQELVAPPLPAIPALVDANGDERNSDDDGDDDDDDDDSLEELPNDLPVPEPPSE